MSRCLLLCVALMTFFTPTIDAMTVCNNSLFATPATWGAGSGQWFQKWLTKGLPMAPHPIPPPSSMLINNTCVAYAKEKEVCCSTETLLDIAETVTSAKEAIATAVKILKDEKGFANQIIGLVGPAVSTFCKPSAPVLPVKMCDKLTSTVATYTARLIDDATQIATDQAQCALALTTYAGGMACMACEVSFASYVDLEKKVIRMSENTCTHVFDKCVQTIQNDVQVLFQTVNDFMSALLNDVAGCGGVCKNLIPKITLEDMCGGTIHSPGDCKHYVCYNMLDGLASSAWLDWSNILSSINIDEPAARLLQEKDSSPTAVFQQLAIDVPRRLHNSLKVGTPTEAVAASHNVYSPDGYDAYGIGCQDTKTCDGFPWFGLVGIVVIAAGVISLAFVIKARGKRNKEGSYAGTTKHGGSAEIAGGYGTLP